MERLFSQKNIERYRRMLANPRDDAQRRVILKLLAEEEATLKIRRDIGLNGNSHR